MEFLRKASSPSRFGSLPFACAMFALFAILSVLPSLTSLIYIHHFGGFDVSWFGQAIWNVSHFGHPFVTLDGDYNHLAVHFEPILYPLGFIYSFLEELIEPYAFLMLTQSLGQLGCLFLLLRFYLSVRSPEKPEFFRLLALFIAYVSFWGVIAAQRFEFHPVALGMSFGFMGIFLAQKRSSAAYVAFCFMMTCGEMYLFSGPVLMTWTKLKSFSTSRQWILIFLQFISFFVGCVLLLLFLQFMAPSFRVGAEGQQHLGRYVHLGRSAPEILKTLFTNFKVVHETLFNKEKMAFLGLISLFFIPIFIDICCVFISSRILNAKIVFRFEGFPLLVVAALMSLAAPLGKIFLSNSPTYLNPENHYLADAMPGLLLLALGFLNLPDVKFVEEQSRRLRYCLPWLFAALSLIVSIQFASKPRGIDFNHVAQLVAEKGIQTLPPELRNWIQSLPKKQSIFSDTLGMSHIMSQRRYYYTEFTQDSVYQRNGPPDVLALVFPISDVLKPNHSLSSWLLKRGESGLEIALGSTRGTRYELEQVLKGQTENGVHIYRKVEAKD